MSNTKNSIIPFVVLILFSAAAITAGMYFSGEMSIKPKPQINGLYFDKAIAVKPFSLIDHNKKLFNSASFKGKWSFVFFGFTHCPDICPPTMTVMKTAFARFKEEPKFFSNTQFVFISVDPQRDTADVLKKYMSYFAKNFIGVTGKKNQIALIAKQFGIPTGISHKHTGKPDSPKNTISHGGHILLINPKGEWQALFRPKHNERKIVLDYISIRTYYR